MALSKIDPAGLDIGQIGGRRNLIINGAMQVAQRGTSFTGVGGSSVQYTLDKWAVREATDAVVDVSQAADSPSTDLFKYCLKLDVTTADTSIAAGQVCTVQHRMEAQDLVLAGFGTANAKQLTISFWHKHTKTGTYSVGFTNHNGTRGYPAEYTQSVSDTWEKSTVTFTADTTGTWATDNTLGMIVYFSVAAGTDFHATVDTWTGANDFASANQVNALDSTSNSFRLTGVQLEVGSVATPFEHRSYGEELALCQRYYYRMTCSGNTNDIAFIGYNNLTTQGQYALQFPVTLRTAPTDLEYYDTKTSPPALDAWEVRALGNRVAEDIVWIASSRTNMYFRCDVTSGLTSGYSCALRSKTSDAFLAVDVEL